MEVLHSKHRCSHPGRDQRRSCHQWFRIRCQSRNPRSPVATEPTPGLLEGCWESLHCLKKSTRPIRKAVRQTKCSTMAFVCGGPELAFVPGIPFSGMDKFRVHTRLSPSRDPALRVLPIVLVGGIVSEDYFDVVSDWDVVQLYQGVVVFKESRVVVGMLQQKRQVSLGFLSGNQRKKTMSASGLWFRNGRDSSILGLAVLTNCRNRNEQYLIEGGNGELSVAWRVGELGHAAHNSVRATVNEWKTEWQKEWSPRLCKKRAGLSFCLTAEVIPTLWPPFGVCFPIGMFWFWGELIRYCFPWRILKRPICTFPDL